MASFITNLSPRNAKILAVLARICHESRHDQNCFGLFCWKSFDITIYSDFIRDTVNSGRYRVRGSHTRQNTACRNGANDVTVIGNKRNLMRCAIDNFHFLVLSCVCVQMPVDGRTGSGILSSP
nr:MAG TPA: hypothetical protein [Caudoviricetes sp.]